MKFKKLYNLRKLLWTGLCGASLLVSCQTSNKKNPTNSEKSSTSGQSKSQNFVRTPSYIKSKKKSDLIVLRKFETQKLTNGLEITYIQDSSLPYVSYQLMLLTGSNVEAQNQDGLASLTADLIETGYGTKTATQIAENLADLATGFNQSVGSDYTRFSSSVLVQDSVAMLDLFYKLISQPSFKQNEIDRLKAEYKSHIKKLKDSPEHFADEEWDHFLYANHVYGHHKMGTEATIKDLTKKQIIQFYFKYYRPNNARLNVVGQITPELKEKIESTFGAWQKREITYPVFEKISDINSLKVKIIDKKDLVQSQIRLGHLGIKRSSPDYLKLKIVNTILGGAFSSRLVDRLRKELGLTYNISSSFDAKEDTGAFEISSFTKSTTVGQSLKEILEVLKRFKNMGVTPEEVEGARAYLKGNFTSFIETAEEFSLQLQILKRYQISENYLAQFAKNIDSISTDEVNQAIRDHIDPQNMKILIYGPKAEILKQIQDIPKVEVVGD